MVIVFENEDVQRECNNHELLIRRYGLGRAKALRMRLDELFNANVLDDFRNLPHVSCYESLKNGRIHFEVELDGEFKLRFEPFFSTTPGKKLGGVDGKKINSIKILGVIGQNEQENT